jgi:hypothetical protein
MPHESAHNEFSSKQMSAARLAWSFMMVRIDKPEKDKAQGTGAEKEGLTVCRYPLFPDSWHPDSERNEGNGPS